MNSLRSLLVGAIAGGAVGNYMDKQQKDLDAAMAEVQRQKEVDMERMKDGTLKLTMSSEVSFDFDSAAIKPAFHDTLNKLADVLRKYDQTVWCT
jgi:outer membrane protein OmpA-like peptidoglycan-associated protein